MARKRRPEAGPAAPTRQSAAEQAAEEQEDKDALDEAEREFWNEQAKDRRKLRELAKQVPGPETANPKDKIWSYLIAEYGFSPETLWRMTHRDLQRCVEARRTTARAQTVTEEWMPASKAVERAQQAGLDINLSTLSRFGERWGVKMRPKTLPGNHQREVEFHSLVVAIAKRTPSQRGTEADDEPSEGEFDERIRKAEAAKRRPIN